jgi:hypothetical protein
VIAIDGAMIDAAIFDILDEIRCEEAIAYSAFAVGDEVDLFGHGSRACSEVARIGNAWAGDA